MLNLRIIFFVGLFQRNVLKTTSVIPHDLNGIISEETFSKARLYNLDSISFGILHSLFDNVVGTVITFRF